MSFACVYIGFGMILFNYYWKVIIQFTWLLRKMERGGHPAFMLYQSSSTYDSINYKNSSLFYEIDDENKELGYTRKVSCAIQDMNI